MDPSDSTAGLVALLALIIVHALFSAMYSSVIQARKQQMKILAEAGNRRAVRVLAITEDSTRLITTQSVINILAYFAAAGLITLGVARPLVQSLAQGGVNRTLMVVTIYPLTWIVGGIIVFTLTDLIPASVAEARAESWAMSSVGVVSLSLTLFAPFSRLLITLSSRFAASVGGGQRVPYITEEEIKHMVDAGQEGGAIEDEEKEMIYSILQFNDKVVREIMIPRIDIEAVDVQTDWREGLNAITEKGHSRVPVYEESIDKIIGVLYAKDLLNVLGRDPKTMKPLREMLRPAHFVPESKRASALLAELQKSKIHMAIVIDEFGGTAGLVTIEDLLEEIVGEIQDEFDHEEEAEVQAISETEFLFDAGISLDEVNDLLDSDLSTDESDTLGGYIFSALGRVPVSGDHFEADSLRVTVETVDGRRIRRVRVVKLPPPTEGMDDGESGKSARATQSIPSLSDPTTEAKGSR